MPTRNEPTRIMPDARLLAAGPKRIVWQIDNVASRDGHELSVRFSATATLATSSADAAMIRETFNTDASSILTETVRDYFLATVEPAIFNHLNRRDAAIFDDGHEVDLACEAVAETLRVAGFAAGVRFVPPFALTVESPSRQRQAFEAATRTRAAEALAHATSTMQQFQKLRDEQPQASIDQVLDQVGPAASESLLPTLLRGWADRTAASRIVVASGEQLVLFSLESDAWRPQPLELSSTIGPLRCVMPVTEEKAFDFCASLQKESPSPQPSPRVQGEGGRYLLVGGQRGVMVLPVVDPTAVTIYRIPSDRISQLGVNQVAIGETRLFATHSGFGLFVWLIDQPESPWLIDHPQAKLATLIGADQCLFAGGDRLFITDGKATREITKLTTAGVVSILSGADGVQVVFADGKAARWKSGQLHLDGSLGGSISLVTHTDWLGEHRLITANDRGEIECVGTTSRTRFVSSHAGWRKIVAATDLVVALSLDRTRLVMWRPWEPTRPMSELHVSSITQHRVSDVTLI